MHRLRARHIAITGRGTFDGNAQWEYAPVRDDRKKLHPSLLGWEDARFSEVEKEKDRNTVRLIPKYLAMAGFQIYHIPSFHR